MRRDRGTALAQYVNDRPYAASSFLSVAIDTAFRTAMAGRCGPTGRRARRPWTATSPPTGATAGTSTGSRACASRRSTCSRARAPSTPAATTAGTWSGSTGSRPYDRPEHLERLRGRSLDRERGLALREYALGIEALDRFTRREPLHRVHECVFAVLALESEPVDPRL